MWLNNFEKHIAGKVNEYPSNLDTDSLWATLESDLEKKRKRKIVIILLILFLVLVMSGIMLYPFETPQNQAIAPGTYPIENEGPSVQEGTSSVEKTNKNENTSVIADSKTSTLNQQEKTQNTTPTAQAVDKDKIIPADHTVHEIAHTSSINSQTTSITRNPNFVLPSEIEVPVLSEIEAPRLENNNTQISRKKNIEKVTFLDLPNINFLEKENNLGTIEISSKFKPVKNWSLYIAPTFGVFHTSRKVSQKNQDGAILKDLRNSSEKTLESLSLGIGMELKNKNNFFLTAGVNFNQITERFDNQSSEFTTENIEIITEINYLSNGERQEVMGTYEQPLEIISTTRVYNTLRWTEFNVGGGYYFTKKRWNLGVSGGLLWGAMLNAEGKILDAESNIIEIKNQNPGIYKTNLGLGAFANLEARYHLKPRLTLSAQFGYKHLPSSFTNESYPLEIKYQWWGATVGVQYKIY